MTNENITISLTPEQFQYLFMAVRMKVTHDERSMAKKKPGHPAYVPNIGRVHLGHEMYDLMNKQDPNRGIYRPTRQLSAEQVRATFDRAAFRKAAREQQLKEENDGPVSD